MGVKEGIKRLAKKLFNIGPEDINDYRKRGVKIGENVQLYSCDLDYGHGYLIEIGNDCIITHTTILTHDASTWLDMGYSKVGRVKIGNNVFIGYGCIILPGVKIGNDVVVGAGSVVRSDIPDNSLAVGNPAEVVCPLDKYLNKNRERIKTAPKYDIPWSEKTQDDIRRMQEELADGTIGYDL